MTGMGLVTWLWRPGGLREIGWGDVALAAFLSLYATVEVSGLSGIANPHSGAVAAVAVLAMTVPVAWERRAPAAAAAVVAVGAAVNELVIGPMIRCGPGLPAVFVIAFFAGTRLNGRRLAVAEGFCAAAVITQALYDPQLGAGFLVAGLPVVAACCLAGRLARSRGLAAAALRERNAELRDQRDQTARLAVAADRARVSADLDDFLRDRITAMAAAAAAGRDLVPSDPAGARGAFAVIETSGRATLAQMRDVVGTLREEGLTGPQPVLAELGSLLESATSADARLHVEGSPRVLPAGLELSAYRIVEHLLTAMQDAPEARIDVRVRFGPDALELDVTGPASRQSGSADSVRCRARASRAARRVTADRGRLSAVALRSSGSRRPLPMRTPDRISRIAGGRRADVLAALGLSAFLLTYLIAQGLLHGANNLLETGCSVGVFGRHHAAQPSRAGGCGGRRLPGRSCPGIVRGLSRQPDPGACHLLRLPLGTADDLKRSVLALLILGAGLQLSVGQFNPIVVVLTIGPWAVGLVIRSRRLLTEQLAARPGTRGRARAVRDGGGSL